MERKKMIAFFEALDVRNDCPLNYVPFMGNPDEYFVQNSDNVLIQYMYNLKKEIGYLNDRAKLTRLNQLVLQEAQMPNFGSDNIDHKTMAAAFFQNDVNWYDFVNDYKEYLILKNKTETKAEKDNSPPIEQIAITPTSQFITFFKNQITGDFLLKLKEKFDTEKGKNIKLLVMALRELDLVSINSREFKNFYNSMKVYFNRDIGTYQSINDFKGAKTEAYKQDFEITKDKINCILNELNKE
jgi:hypothetical protein